MSLFDYELHEVLGSGAAGTVHRATHVPSSTVVALKQVHTDDARLMRAVEQEVRAMARVGHPNLLGLYDHGRLLDRGGLWLSVEYASGGALDTWSPSSWKDVWRVLDDLLHGLAHAHARGLVHRDLKPANLLLATHEDRSPGLKIADFGLTVLRGVDPAIRRGGTPEYMAPEQWRGLDPTPAADLYALGCILWEWVTGRPPFVGDIRSLKRQHTTSSLPPLSPRVDLPEGLPDLLQALLAKTPEDRPLSAGAVRRRLEGRSRGRAVRQLLLPRPTLRAAPPGMGLGLLDVRDHHVVGQEDVRQTLVSSLEQVLKQRRAHVHFVSGPPGAGKTRMARWLAESAAESGVVQLLADPTVAAVQEAVQHGPVIALFDDMDADVDQRLRALLYTGGPLLALACVSPAWHWAELERIDAVHRVELGPMSPKAYRWFLTSQLGLSPSTARRLEAGGSGVPGVATAWTRDLAARGKLTAGAEGFELLDGALSPPPVLHRGAQALVAVVCEHADPKERSALRLGAMFGDRVQDAAWEGARTRLGLPHPSALVLELSDAGLLAHRDDGWRWASATARRAALEGAVAREWLAVADTLEAPPCTPEDQVRAGLARLRAGDIPDARERLLVSYPMDLQLGELIREAVEALRPHMEHASTTQKVAHRRLDMVTHLNLGTPQEAEPMARTLAQALGTVYAPGPHRMACQPSIRHSALESAALVFAHLRKPDDALELLAGIPESPDGLRIRAMVAMADGDLEAARTLARRGYDACTEAHHRVSRSSLANDLGTIAGMEDDPVAAEAWFRQSILDADPAMCFTQTLNVAIALVAQGRARDAVRPARRGLVLAEKAGQLVRFAYVTNAVVAALAEREQDVRHFGDTALAMVRTAPAAAIPPLRDAMREASSTNPAIQRFIEAFRQQLPG